MRLCNTYGIFYFFYVPYHVPTNFFPSLSLSLICTFFFLNFDPVLKIFTTLTFFFLLNFFDTCKVHHWLEWSSDDKSFIFAKDQSYIYVEDRKDKWRNALNRCVLFFAKCRSFATLKNVSLSKNNGTEIATNVASKKIFFFHDFKKE